MDWEIHGGRYPLTDALVLFMSCEMNQGYLTSQPDSSGFFSTFITLMAARGGGGGFLVLVISDEMQ